mmetsp:Transcript_63948/g.177400  ORF Transcript_63948/g.177400 Transcript_63948/m.177400 type:complete len:211 (+) Transcript_63948:138-770(+)
MPTLGAIAEASIVLVQLLVHFGQRGRAIEASVPRLLLDVGARELVAAWEVTVGDLVPVRRRLTVGLGGCRVERVVCAPFARLRIGVSRGLHRELLGQPVCREHLLTLLRAFLCHYLVRKDGLGRGHQWSHGLPHSGSGCQDVGDLRHVPKLVPRGVVVPSALVLGVRCPIKRLHVARLPGNDRVPASLDVCHRRTTGPEGHVAILHRARH